LPRPEIGVAFVGCGYTDLTRKPAASDMQLTLAACRAAANDAGLDPADIDGINIQVHHYPPPDTAGVITGLGMRQVNWREDGGIGVGSLARAANALEAKQCHTIVVCKVMNTAAPISTPEIDTDTGAVGGPGQFEVPYGLGYTMQRVGLTSRRWMHRFGVTHEQVGWLCVVQREHALLNRHAIMRSPLSLEDYLASRWISAPLRLYDCDYPVNGAFAYIITREDRSRSLLHEPVFLLGWVDSGIAATTFHLYLEDVGGMIPLAQQLYTDTGLRPEQMDVWLLYDGYSFFALQWMENLGLVPRGESGAYVEGGSRIRYDGEHPLNTHGGQLSEGRMHGAGHILEAVQQLRGTAGERQAKRAEFAIVSSAFPNSGAAAIFGRK
jgi:acetyl-CoA acetyltransferase